MSDLVQLEKSLQFTIENLRERLARRNMAFGALFIGLDEGHMIVMPENMPSDLRIQMLTDLRNTADKTIEHYRKAS